MSRTPTCWTNTQNGHNKFWAAKITNKGSKIVLMRTWGSLEGEQSQQSMEQEFENINEARITLEQLIRVKEREGYVVRY